MTTTYRDVMPDDPEYGFCETGDPYTVICCQGVDYVAFAWTVDSHEELAGLIESVANNYGSIRAVQRGDELKPEGNRWHVMFELPRACALERKYCDWCWVEHPGGVKVGEVGNVDQVRRARGR